MPSWQCLQHCWVIVAFDSPLASSNLPYSNAASLAAACMSSAADLYLAVHLVGRQAQSCLLYLDLHVNQHICDCAGVCSAAGLLEPGYGEMARHAHFYLAHH